MAKPKKKVEVKADVSPDAKLLLECIEHQTQSENYLATIRDTWDEKESMLIGRLEDSLSKKSKNKVFDHRLSTIVFERAARVMSQNPKGKAYAVSKDDTGKNALMNLMLNFYRKNDNEQFSHLIKLRLLDLYSLVYGTMFAQVSWRVNQANGYVGPSLYIIPIRDAFPQPGVKSTNEMDWFTVRTMVSAKVLQDADPKFWKKENIEKLLKETLDEKKGGDKAKTDNQRSYVERTLYPSQRADEVYPQIELFTEYRKDKWITWAPQRINSETSHPYILRIVEDANPDGMLPIISKHCFPLIDSPIGIGEFERGKSLQYALNSLINLYLDGVKYSIFPPLAINPDNVVPSSIKWGAGEKWFMNNPNVDVQPVSMSPRGIETFNSTYGFMLGALYNQAGTSEVSSSQKTESSLGKTPQAIRLQSVKEGARDEWDRFMMEEAITDIYKRFIALTVKNLNGKVTLRLFKEEIEDIKKYAPDVVEMFTSGARGKVSVTGKAINDQYDFELETGSTMKPNIEDEQSNLTNVLRAVIENPSINESLALKDKTIDIGELFKMWMLAGGLKNVDKVIIDKVVKEAAGNTPVASESVPPVPQDMTTPEVPTPEVPIEEEQAPSVPVEGEASSDFKDVDIREAARKLLMDKQVA